MPFYLYDYRPLCASKACFDAIEKAFKFKNKDIRVTSILKEYKNCSLDLFKDHHQTIACLRYLNRLDQVMNGMIYLPRPEELNDPNECLAWLDTKKGHSFIKDMMTNRKNNEIEQLLKKIQQEEKERYLPFDPFREKDKDHKKYFGIKSFTTDPTNELMWSHYATQHQGICLKFELADAIASSLHNNKLYASYYDNGRNFTFDQVKYDIGGKEADNGFNIDDDYYNGVKKTYDSFTRDEKKVLSLADYIGLTIINTKSILWQYEKEIRFTAFGLCEKIPLKTIMIPNTTTPVLELKAIIFGQYVDPRFKHIIMKSYDSSQLKVYDAEPKEGSTYVKIV